MPIVVNGAQAHEFFATQGSVVGDENQGPIARRFVGDDVQDDPFPDLGRGHPRQASAPSDEAMLRRVAGPSTTSANNWVNRVGSEARADQIFVELTECDHMLGDGRLSDTGTGKRDHVLRQRTRQPRTDSRYAPVAQVVEIGEHVTLISFDPPLGRCLLEPGQKSLQVSRVGVDRLGPAGEPAKPNHKCTRRRHGADSRVQIPPDRIVLTLDRAQIHLPGSHNVYFAL